MLAMGMALADHRRVRLASLEVEKAWRVVHACAALGSSIVQGGNEMKRLHVAAHTSGASQIASFVLRERAMGPVTQIHVPSSIDPKFGHNKAVSNGSPAAS